MSKAPPPSAKKKKHFPSFLPCRMGLGDIGSRQIGADPPGHDACPPPMHQSAPGMQYKSQRWRAAVISETQSQSHAHSSFCLVFFVFGLLISPPFQTNKQNCTCRIFRWRFSPRLFEPTQQQLTSSEKHIKLELAGFNRRRAATTQLT